MFLFSECFKFHPLPKQRTVMNRDLRQTSIDNILLLLLLLFIVDAKGPHIFLLCGRGTHFSIFFGNNSSAMRPTHILMSDLLLRTTHPSDTL